MLYPPVKLSPEFASVFDLRPIFHQILNFHKGIFLLEIVPSIIHEASKHFFGYVTERSNIWDAKVMPGWKWHWHVISKKLLHQLFPFWDPESGCMTKCIRLWMKPSTNRKTKNAISGKYLLTFTILWSALQLKWVEIYIQNVISLFLISTILGVQIHLGFKI